MTKHREGKHPRAVAGETPVTDGFEADLVTKGELPHHAEDRRAKRMAAILRNTGRTITSDDAVRARLPNGLTLRQERYARNVLAGMTYADAYRDAYDCKNVRPAVVYSRAYDVASNPRVRKRIAELWRDREQRLSHTSAQLRLWVLERLMTEARDGGNPASVRVRAVELVGRLGGVGAFEDTAKASDNAGQAVDEKALLNKVVALLSQSPKPAKAEQQDDNGQLSADSEPDKSIS